MTTNRLSSDDTCFVQGQSARLLATWLRTERFPDRLIRDDMPHRAAVMDIVYGTVKWKRQLQWILRICATRRVPTAWQPWAWVGLYQIFHMDDTPDYAAVHETVEAAKTHMPTPAIGFLNAILRRALRERDAIESQLAASPLGLRYSHPDILIQRWRRQMTQASIEKLCVWNNARAAVTLRTRTPSASAEARHTLVHDAGIQAEPHPFSPLHYLTLSPGTAVTALPGFAQGNWVIQDPSGSVAGDLLDPQPGDTILDACAAPGGKTAWIIDRTGGGCQLTAVDRHDDRVALLRHTVKRLNLPVAAIVSLDATKKSAMQRRFGAGTFDRILLDVPCSNTGVLRRRPDARWRFSEERLTARQRTQRALLDACAPLLKSGGTLVYSTCSLEPEENEMLITDWLSTNPAFQHITHRHLFPPETGTDGAFAACLKRNAPS